MIMALSQWIVMVFWIVVPFLLIKQFCFFSLINFVNAQSQTPNIVDVDRIRLSEGGSIEVQPEVPADTSISGALTATITGDFSIIYNVADTENPQTTYTTVALRSQLDL